MYLFNFFRQHLYFFLGSALGLLTTMITIPIFESNTDCFQYNINENAVLHDALHKIPDEYEPQINLAGKPLKAQKIPQSFIRPRYFSTELGIRQKLLISVLSSSSSVQTNAIAINKTVAHLAEKILYFVDTSSKLNLSKLHMPDIVAFIDSRHMLKPFHMFKYLIDNYLQEFDYFFIVNDSSYINFRKLHDMVSKISVREDVYLGQSIDRDSDYCSLNAGIVLSNSILKYLANNIDWCIKNVHSDSNDVNVGKCIVHSANVKCSSGIMGQRFSSFNDMQSPNVVIELQYLLRQNEFNEAVTVYPITQPNYFYILHAYFTRKGLEADLNSIKDLKKAIRSTASKFPDIMQNMSWPIGNQPGNIPVSRFDVLHWKYFTNTSLYLRDDFTTVSQHTQLEFDDINRILNYSISYIQSKYTNRLTFENLQSGYKKFDLSRGMDYILDLEFKSTLTKSIVRKRVHVCKPLGKIDILKTPYVTENTRINFILRVSPRDVNMTMRFITQYRKLCLEKREKTFLMLVLLYEPHLPGKDSKQDIYKHIKDKAVSLTKDFRRDNSKISWLSIKVPKNLARYSYLHDHLLNFAILDLALRKFTNEALIFFTTPYTEFYNDFLNRIRMNTINGYQVFNPIPFTEYSPNITQHISHTIDINKSIGHFNVHSTEHLSFYAKDYFKARNKISHKVPTVRVDKDILNLTRYINPSDEEITPFLLDNILHIFRLTGDKVHVLQATEPNLRVYYKNVLCEEHSDSSLGKLLYERCVYLRNNNLGSRSQLSKIVMQYISKAS